MSDRSQTKGPNDTTIIHPSDMRQGDFGVVFGGEYDGNYVLATIDDGLVDLSMADNFDPRSSIESSYRIRILNKDEYITVRYCGRGDQ